MFDYTENKYPIDAVITWVDGTDSKFLKKKQKFSKGKNIPEANIASRYNQVGEIDFVIKSILKNVTFIRKIFIVTDNQIPKVLVDSQNWLPEYQNKLQLVDHKEIFSDYISYLPSFNILSIESLFHEIKGLSEHFIYFNDDMFVVRPTKIEDWFLNGKPIIRGRWVNMPDKVWYKVLKNWFFSNKNKFSFKKSQALSAKIAGFKKKYFRTYHNPRALKKSYYKNFYDGNKELLANQIKPRFRLATQYNAYALAWHYAIKNQLAITTKEMRLVEVNFSIKDNPNKVLRGLKKVKNNDEILFLNLQSLDLVPKSKLESIINVLNDIIKIDLTKKN